MKEGMDIERLDKLTDQQRACLRMVYLHMTSKEIAPRLGIEPGSVDQHIKAAMRILGVGERRAAARMLAEYESGRGKSEALGLAVHEDQAGFEAAAPLREPIFPLPLDGRRPGKVGAMKRLAWIAGITIGIALAFGALISGVEALSRLIWTRQ